MGTRYGDIDITVKFDNGWYATTRCKATEYYDPGSYYEPPYSELDVDPSELTDRVVLSNDEMELEFSDEFLGQKGHETDLSEKLNWDRIYKEISERNFSEGDDFQVDDSGPDYDDMDD